MNNIINKLDFPYDVSFVVISKNESFTITRCIKSIIRCGEALLNYEIIFIDSLSSDNTLERVNAIKNKHLRIFLITKSANAAVARNIGIEHVKYEYIFFVDGDVEIQADFVFAAIEEMINSPQIGAIYGQLKEFQYYSNYNKIYQIVKDRYNIQKRIFQIVRGGIFFTRYSVLKDIGYFDNRLKRGQDRDYIMRITSKYKVLGLPITMGTHHTVVYRNIIRIKEWLFDFKYRYTGLLLRKHILNIDRALIILKKEYGLTLGILFWPLLFSNIFFPSIFIKIIFGLFLLGDIFLGFKKESKHLIGRIISHYIFSVYFLFGFLFYFPRKKKIEYKEISYDRKLFKREIDKV